MDLGEVEPQLTSLPLADDGLRGAEFLRKLDLRQARGFSGLAKEASEGQLLWGVDRLFHPLPGLARRSLLTVGRFTVADRKVRVRIVIN